MSGAVVRRVLPGELALLPDRDHRALRVAVDHQIVVAVLRHRRLQIGEPGPDRLLIVEVEEPREFPPRLIRPRCATRPEDALGPEREAEEANEPGDGPPLLGRRDRDGLDRLARMGWRDELVHDDLDVGVVPRRDAGPAHDQGGLIGRRYVRGRVQAVDTGATGAITTSMATPIDAVIRMAAYFALPTVGPPSMSRNDVHGVGSSSAIRIVGPPSARRTQ